MPDKEKLILDNLGLAKYMAKQFRNCPIPYEDRVSIAYLGLVKAANTFDETRQVKFITYAFTVMRTEILLELRKQRKRMKTLSLDRRIMGKDGSEVFFAEVIPDHKEDYRKVELSDFKDWILKNLPEREKAAVELTVCEGLEQKEASRRMGISQSYVSKCSKRGLALAREAYWREESRCI